MMRQSEISGKRLAMSSFTNDGFSWASFSSLVPGRMVSSASIMPAGVRMGLISRAKWPPDAAIAARRWDSAEKASSSARDRLHRAATRSAQTPCETGQEHNAKGRRDHRDSCPCRAGPIGPTQRFHPHAIAIS